MEHVENANQFIQYGALGLLGLVIFFGLQMVQRAGERSNKTVDALTSQIAKLDSTIHEASASNHQQFSDAQRLLDRFEITLEKIASAHKDAVYTMDKNHAVLLAKVEESAKDTRHSIKNDLQLLFLKQPKIEKEAG